jgi:hypothetical protein
MATDATRGSSWNAGAWFGAQLGGTVWMLIASLFLAGQSLVLAALVAGLFVVPNLVGLGLWRSRQRRSIFTAFQVLLMALWPCAMVAIYAVDRAGYWDTLAWQGRNVPAASAYVLLTVLVVALVLMFRYQQRAVSRASGGGV